MADQSALVAELSRSSTETVDTCILCTGRHGRRDTKWEALLALRPPYAVMRCARCGLRWLSPRPGADGLAVIYSANHYFGGTTDFDQHAAQRTGQFQARISRLKAMGVRSILDYGAATGGFIALASASGLDAMGVEFSEAARDQATSKYGITLLTPEQGDRLDSSFDAIHMNHVLEHMPDPMAHIRWCFDHLRPGGVLVIEVPKQFDNDADLLRRVTGRGGRQVQFDAFSLHHTYFFTPTTLRKALALGGFSIASLHTPLSPNPHSRSTTRRLLDKLLAWSARELKRGDVIEAYAVKPAASRS